MKKTLLSVALLGAIFAVGCSQPAPKADKPKEQATATAPATTAPAYVGNYAGTIACADCDGIETTVELKADGTYIITEKYLKQGEQKTETVEGKATFDDKTSIVTLEGKDAASARKLLVEGETITFVDADGKKSESKELNYSLKKAVEAPKADANAKPAEGEKPADAPKADAKPAEGEKPADAPKADAKPAEGEKPAEAPKA